MKTPRNRVAFPFAAFLCVSLLVFFLGSRLSEAQAENAGAPTAASPSTSAEAVLPGPMRSFLRMAGISQQAPPEEVLPLLADQVGLTRGYMHGHPTEFLILLRHYLQQAHELAEFAGARGEIRVAGCDEAKPLLDILGYRLRRPCGPDTSVQTSDPDRAFLTIDSGFPLAELEQKLQEGKPFVLSYP